MLFAESRIGKAQAGKLEEKARSHEKCRRALFSNADAAAIQGLFRLCYIPLTSLVVQMVKNLPAMWETGVWSLGQEDPLQKGTATHSSIVAWRILWTGEPDGQQSMGL